MALSCPTPWRKGIVIGLAIFSGLISSSASAHPAFFPVQSTPYDHQMTRVHPALTSINGKSSGPISLDTVNGWMTQLRAMPYRFSHYWQTPGEVTMTQASDCKGKAVALYAQMRRSGAKCVRVVIGKRHLYDSNTHAWLEWETNAGSYMLDPTFNENAVRADGLDPMTYIPFYAYDAEHKYRASPSFAASSSRVATGYSDHVYTAARTGSAYTPTGATYSPQPTFTAFGAPQFTPPAPQYTAPVAQYRTSGSQSSWSQQISTPDVARPVSTPAYLSPVAARSIVYRTAAYPPLTTNVRSLSAQNRIRSTHPATTGTRYRRVRHVTQHHKHSSEPKLASTQS